MFKDRELKNALFKIAVPVALQNLLTSLLNMIDTMMIGSLGDKAVAAVGLANQWFFIFNLITFGIVSGSTIYISQFYGKKDYDNMHLPVAYSMFLCTALSLIFSFLAVAFPGFVMSLFTNNAETIICGIPYLRIAGFTYLTLAIALPLSVSMRSTESTVIPLIITTLAIGINTSLNYLLISGRFGAPALGVSGAAIATLIARIVEVILLLIYMWFGKTKIKLKLKHFKPNKAFIPEYLKTILPVVGNEGMWGLGISMYNVMFGRMSDSIVAARQISGNLENILTSLCFGLGSAAAVIIGKKIGEQKQDQALSYSKKFAILSTCTGLFIGIVMIISLPFFLKLFSVSPDAKNYATQLITVSAIFMAVRMFNYMCIVGILRSGGDTRFCFYLDAGAVWCIGVLSVFLAAFVFHAPFWVIALCLVSEEVVKSIGGLLRFRSKKWLNDLVN